MKKIMIILLGLGCAFSASAGSITTSGSAPASGTYLADANNLSSNGAGVWVKESANICGQSFTHTEAGDANWQLGSVTFFGYGLEGGGTGVNRTDESAANLVLRIYQGADVTTGTQVGSDISFGTGTFDSWGTFMTFGLSAADTAAIGDLTSGTQYSAVLLYTNTMTTGGFRIAKGADTYSGGTVIYNSGTLASDATFYIEGTAIAPSPVSAVINVSTNSGVAPLEVVFDGSGSSSTNGAIASYAWDFGDGNTASGVLATNVYTEDGTYTATLTVTDVNADSAMATVEIVVDTWNLPANIVLTTDVAVVADPPIVSATDLAQTYYLSSSVTKLSKGSQTNLFNGSVGTSASTTGAELGLDASVTVNFDTSDNKLGYDISSISTVFGWNDRARQGYRIVVTYVDDTTASLAGPELWEAANGYWTTVSFAETNGLPMAIGVKAVTFDKIYQAAPGGVVIAREFDIFGAPTPNAGTLMLVR